MAYDPVRQRCVLFGGIRFMQTVLRDTWEWNGQEWREMAPIHRPTYAGGQLAAAAVLAYSPALQRMVMAGRATDEVWELLRPCEDIGRGHAVGGPIMTCTSEPVLGGRLELTYQSRLGFGAMIASPSCNDIAIDVFAPLFCSRGSVYPALGESLLFGLAGNPARFSLPVPFDPDGLHLLGQSFCFQGVTVEPSGCLRLTQGVRVLVSRPY
jgi:hypothetical protein